MLLLNEIDHVRFLETNDDNWYKLCIKEVRWKQMNLDEYIKNDNKIDQIRFEGIK